MNYSLGHGTRDLNRLNRFWPLRLWKKSMNPNGTMKPFMLHPELFKLTLRFFFFKNVFIIHILVSCNRMAML